VYSFQFPEGTMPIRKWHTKTIHFIDPTPNKLRFLWGKRDISAHTLLAKGINEISRQKIKRLKDF
jgi:hypothetical protein